MSNIQYFVIIGEQKKKDKFLQLLGEYGAHVIESVYAHGSVSTNTIAAAFGFEFDPAKIMITCLLKTEKAKELIEILYKEYKFNKPNTGIAYSIKVDEIAF